MVDAINTVVSLADVALNSCGGCIVLALDDKNAYNSANWDEFKGALIEIRVSGYLAGFVKIYSSEKTLWYRTDAILEDYIVAAEIP